MPAETHEYVVVYGKQSNGGRDFQIIEGQGPPFLTVARNCAVGSVGHGAAVVAWA